MGRGRLNGLVNALAINACGCIQILSRNTTVDRGLIEICRPEIKGKNGNIWNVTPKEQCGPVIHKEEKGRQRSDGC